MDSFPCGISGDRSCSRGRGRRGRRSNAETGDRDEAVDFRLLQKTIFNLLPDCVGSFLRRALRCFQPDLAAEKGEVRGAGVVEHGLVVPDGVGVGGDAAPDGTVQVRAGLEDVVADVAVVARTLSLARQEGDDLDGVAQSDGAEAQQSCAPD